MARDPDLSHVDVRDEFLDRFPNTIYGLGEWRRYDAGIWQAMHEQVIRREIQAVAEAVARGGRAIQVSHNVISSVFNLLKARTFVPDEKFDANPEILTFDDCSLHLPTREPISHSPQNYFTSKLPFKYDPDGRSQVWMDFLASTVPECQDFLQEFAWYCLTTSTEYEMALWLYGPPGGGKSTFVAGLSAMLGSRSCVLGLSEIAGNQFALTNLPGKTLAISTEQPADFLSATHTLNALISGEPVPVNRKYKDPIEVTSRAKFIWAMNELPRTSGMGLFRRVKVVPFPGIPIEARNPRIREAIAEAGMGIANWALDGGPRLQERGRFLIPASVTDASEDYRISNDVPLLFLTERCVLQHNSRILSSELYDAYTKWCEMNGHYRESSTKFGIDLTRLGIEKSKSGARYRLGLRLKEEGEEEAEEILDRFIANGQDEDKFGPDSNFS